MDLRAHSRGKLLLTYSARWFKLLRWVQRTPFHHEQRESSEMISTQHLE